MERVFRFQGSFMIFLKGYFQYAAPYSMIGFTIAFQLFNMKNIKHNYYYTVGIAVLTIIVILFYGWLEYRKYINTLYIVSSGSIQIFDHLKNRAVNYPYNELESVRFPAQKESGKSGRQSFKLFFSEDRTLVFTSVLPFYEDIRNEIREKLIQYGRKDI